VETDEAAQTRTEAEPRATDPARSRVRRPPTIAGYVLHTLLGHGAYGEVWLGESRTTKRQVAVKFLHSRTTLDWSLLDGETEKLAFLAADRRVVQLLDVGRDADPPFFVMEYVARGSLARHLETVGPLPLERAVATFEEIALGLMQVHGKGILHCDLKPSNILLDGELRPRLADFGQSRLADDRSPALGTPFFMAPEQADPAAVPDARWDMYALGAVLHAMLEGRPPYESDAAIASIRAEPDLARRLARYRQIVSEHPRPPLPTRKLDRALGDILARCLAVDPRKRFSTVREVVDALRRRREARARRPMLLLGGVGPVLLLAVMIVFGVRSYRRAKAESADAIRRRAFESNKFAAAFIARSFEGEVRRYLDIVSEEAALPGFQAALSTVLAMPERERLGDAGPDRQSPQAAALVEGFIAHPSRRALDAYFRARLDVWIAEARRDLRAPRFVSIFALDAHGTHLGAAYSDPEIQTRSVGRYYAWRSYFHGGPADLPRATPRERVSPITRPHLSAPYRSTTTKAWRVGVATPLFEREGGRSVFVGVLVFSVDLGDFDLLAVDGQPARDRFAALVDLREGEGRGRIVLHPYFADVAADNPDRPDRARPFVDQALLRRMTDDWRLAYRDPFGDEPGGAAYQGLWIAAAQPLHLPSPEGLIVLVQERSDAATGPVEALGSKLLREALLALSVIALAMGTLWLLALRARATRAERAQAHDPTATAGPRPLRDRSTLSETDGDHG
jgi:hypothetical protein